MPTRAEVVAEALSCIDTPYVHQGRLKGVGADCIGLVIIVARAFGISDYDKVDYGRNPDAQMLLGELGANLIQIAPKEALEGDILLFRIKREPQHVGIITRLDPRFMVHSYSRTENPRCIEQEVSAFWWDRVVAAYRYPGVA